MTFNRSVHSWSLFPWRFRALSALPARAVPVTWQSHDLWPLPCQHVDRRGSFWSGALCWYVSPLFFRKADVNKSNKEFKHAIATSVLITLIVLKCLSNDLVADYACAYEAFFFTHDSEPHSLDALAVWVPCRLKFCMDVSQHTLTKPY